MDFNTLLFRASCNGDIMTAGTGEVTDKQSETIAEYKGKDKLTDKQRDELARLIEKRDNPTLSTTCIKRLIKMYAQVLGREEEIRSKYMEKGTRVEDDSITLYSRLKKKVFIKNVTHLTNRYAQGTPDLGDAETIQESEDVIDIKSCWSLITFLQAKFTETNSDYDAQGTTYLGLLPKAKRFTIAYCLVNAPGDMVTAEKAALKWKMPDVIDPDMHPEYKEKCKQIEINHIFDIKQFVEDNPGFAFDNELEEWTYDIPMQDRCFEIIIQRDDNKINALYKKVERCRRWLDEKFNKKAA